jgi:hypothetical protein
MIKNTSRKNTTQNGYLAVETAIFLPIFIIGLLTFGYLIKFLLIEEAIFHAFTDETRVLCSEARINPLNVVQFESVLERRTSEEIGDNVSSMDVDHVLYLYPANGMTGMISMDLNYDVNVRLPVQIVKILPVAESLMCRGFIGSKEDLDPLGFDEMEKVKDSDLVWIFPRAGGKYHDENCICIKSEPFQVVLSYKIKKAYSPCSICDSKNLAVGSLVYCFKTGNSYHSANCPSVDKYVISIEKDEAIKKGYSACLKCGGE